MLKSRIKLIRNARFVTSEYFLTISLLAIRGYTYMAEKYVKNEAKELQSWMLPRERTGPLVCASLYSGLSTTPWKPKGPKKGL